MALVSFEPAGLSVEVESGTSLLDAATSAGVTITAPCGGEGACGACRVRVARGSVERVSLGCLSPEELGDGWVLACSSRVLGDATILVEDAVDEDGRIVTDHAGNGHAHHHAHHGPDPLAVKRALNVPEPALENNFSDLERVAMALREAGGPASVSCGLGVLRQVAAALRAQDHAVTVTLVNRCEAGAQASCANGAAEIVRIEPGDTTRRAFGVAIDIGTTTCALQLVDLTRGHVVGTAAEYNGQIARGLDIISRINYAKQPERREELRRLVLDNLNGLIGDVCAEHAVAAGEIDNAVIAGNTTMMHLLLGLDPEFIRLEPYTPTSNRWPLLRASEVGLKVNPEAYVTLVPGVGSYVGGDITAGLLQTALVAESDEVRLFLDIGTNGEVVVGNGEWLMTCAASAGPAFEGSGVSCGMRASKGAIERVRIDPATGRAEVKVIGGARPKGVCGSGMIDLLAELWLAGLLDPSGKLDPTHPSGLVVPVGESKRNMGYTIVPAEASETGAAIVIDEQDIQNLLRTKAAIYSACALMLGQVGLDFDAVSQVYVAGGFGRFLDLEKSIMIGLLPDLPLERYTYLGNSALAGAQAMLMSGAARRKAEDLANRMTYLELNVDPSYMDEYMAALFLPHTDIERFPTVKTLRGQ